MGGSSGLSVGVARPLARAPHALAPPFEGLFFARPQQDHAHRPVPAPAAPKPITKNPVTMSSKYPFASEPSMRYPAPALPLANCAIAPPHCDPLVPHQPPDARPSPLELSPRRAPLRAATSTDQLTSKLSSFLLLPFFTPLNDSTCPLPTGGLALPTAARGAT